jgi:hypothetical protein
VYSPDFGNLNKSLFELADENTRIILAYEKRDASDVEFFKMLAKNFKYSKASFICEAKINTIILIILIKYYNIGEYMSFEGDLTLFFLKVPDSKLDPKWRSDDIGIFEIRKLPEAQREPFDFKAWRVPWATTEVAKKDIVHPKPEDEEKKDDADK